MLYIITESQNKLLKEQYYPSSITKRYIEQVVLDILKEDTNIDFNNPRVRRRILPGAAHIAEELFYYFESRIDYIYEYGPFEDLVNELRDISS